MADCTQDSPPKGLTQNYISQGGEKAVSSIQPSIVNTLASFAITRTDPSNQGEKERETERKRGKIRAERANESGPPP